MTNILSCGLVLAALALAASPAAAQGGGRPWCFYESGNRGSGAVTCTFYSYQQCMATASGIGGTCAQNPYPSSGASYPADASTGRRKQRPY